MLLFQILGQIPHILCRTDGRMERVRTVENSMTIPLRILTRPQQLGSRLLMLGIILGCENVSHSFTFNSKKRGGGRPLEDCPGESTACRCRSHFSYARIDVAGNKCVPGN